MCYFSPFFTPYNYYKATLYYKNYKFLEYLKALVRDSILKERDDQFLLDYLVSFAPTHKEKNIIMDIKDIKKKHINYLNEIYTFYTDQSIASLRNASYECPKSYITGIMKARLDELDEFEIYRNITTYIPDKFYRNKILEILTDMLKNIQKYDYISYLNYNSNFKNYESDNNILSYSIETQDIKRNTKEFTLSELVNYNGSMGKPAYVAVNGTVYDVSNEATWGGASHFGLIAGKNLTSQFLGCHNNERILAKLPKVGILKSSLDSYYQPL